MMGYTWLFTPHLWGSHNDLAAVRSFWLSRRGGCERSAYRRHRAGAQVRGHRRSGDATGAADGATDRRRVEARAAGAEDVGGSAGGGHVRDRCGSAPRRPARHRRREITRLPHSAGVAALHSPHTAITDFVAIAQRIAEEIEAAGGRVLLSTTVTGVDRHLGRIDVVAGAERHTVDRLVVCGGLESDRLGELVGGTAAPRIVPFRGEYMSVTATKQDFVRGMIYPVPDPRYPFLGVHFTRRVSGGLEVGPNAFLALSRQAYGRLSLSPRDLGSTLAWPGFWRFAGEHWRTGLTEIRGVLSKRAYMKSAQRYVPDIGVADVTRSHLGLRAQAVERNGSLVDDFVIQQEDGITSVRNAPSPAATSSLAIAQHVVDRIEIAV